MSVSNSISRFKTELNHLAHLPAILVAIHLYSPLSETCTSISWRYRPEWSSCGWTRNQQYFL